MCFQGISLQSCLSHIVVLGSGGYLHGDGVLARSVFAVILAIRNRFFPVARDYRRDQMINHGRVKVQATVTIRRTAIEPVDGQYQRKPADPGERHADWVQHCVDEPELAREGVGETGQRKYDTHHGIRPPDEYDARDELLDVLVVSSHRTLSIPEEAGAA